MTVAGDDTDQAFWEDIQSQFTEFQRGQRRGFTGLENDRVASGKPRGDFRGKPVWMIEWNDPSGDTERLADKKKADDVIWRLEQCL